MITVITHFYNEERMLPWWLRHHRQLFDHGVLIDHGSTDRSVEICRELAPDWMVMPSKMTEFDAIGTDFEVMNVEATLPGWKMALNTTEFLVAPDLRRVLSEAQEKGVMGLRTHGAIMVDATPEEAPDPDRPLIEQKHHGYVEEGWRLWYVAGKRTKGTLRRRLIHRYPHGAYHPGRHKSFRSAFDAPSNMFTCWFGFSPWTDWFKARKTQIVDKVPKSDSSAGFGGHHTRDLARLDEQYRRRLRVSSDLSQRFL